MRPLCRCGYRPRAINYYKNDRAYYRRLCEVCLYNGVFAKIPRWQRAGYKIKDQCERCGFKSRDREVFRVFHIDGNLDNCRFSNLKTICANCAAVLYKENSIWKQGDLIADY